MTLHTKNPPAGGADGPLECQLLAGVDSSKLKPPHQKPQIKFQDPAEAEFDAEIARALVASGWRATACLLTHAALLIETGDFQSAERNRRQARGQFVEANDLFKLFQEMRAAEAVSIFAAEGFR